MGTAYRHLQSGTHHRVVKGGGYLAYAASDLFHHFAAAVGSRPLVPLLCSTLPHYLIKGHFLPGIDDGAVERLRSQADIGVSLAVGRGVGGIFSYGLVLFFGDRYGDLRLHLTGRGRNLRHKIFGCQSLFNVRCQLFLIDGNSHYLSLKDKGVTGCIVAGYGTVLSRFVPELFHLFHLGQDCLLHARGV